MKLNTKMMNKVNWMIKNIGDNLESLEYSNGDIKMIATIKSYEDHKGVKHGYIISSIHEDRSEIKDSHFTAYLSSKDSCEREPYEDDDGQLYGGREYWDINVEFKALFDISKREWVITDIIDDDYLDEYDNENYEHMNMLLDVMNKRTGIRTQKLDDLSKNIKDMYEWIYDKKWEEKVL